ncbi:phosphate--AMP phosphotransferase [candidate division KSB1 bacterium]|nr:phosphate--AMP phosphotransferase [candidate division KSB1 bacterium]
MLEKIDLTQSLSKADYKKVMPALEIKLAELQRQARDKEIPVVVVFQGWDAAGKGTLINRLMLALDPRGYRVYPVNPPTHTEKRYPFLWRFWKTLPVKGRIAIYDRSWYGRVLVERVDQLTRTMIWKRAFEEITEFERQLCDDGHVLVKFFLHISKKEQKKRFKKLEKNSSTAWKVTKTDWKHHKKYKKYVRAIEEMLAETDTDYAPWTIVEAHDRCFATVKIFQTLINQLQHQVEQRKKKANVTVPRINDRVKVIESSSSLHNVDLALSLSKEEYKKNLDVYQNRMVELEHEIFLKRIPVVIVYEGWDAAGKGGNIKRLVRTLDPRGFTVIPIGAPNDVEKAHHYLWRFWIDMPKAGHIAIFDRSWYGRVLVERVEGYARPEEWQRAFREINEMEKQWSDFGVLLVKFWLQIDKEEQLQRFKARETTPHKRWKITKDDWHNREKWDQYQEAVDEMLLRTSTTYAPWTIVESNCKRYARIKAIRTVIEQMEHRLDDF